MLTYSLTVLILPLFGKGLLQGFGLLLHLVFSRFLLGFCRQGLLLTPRSRLLPSSSCKRPAISSSESVMPGSSTTSTHHRLLLKLPWTAL
ncbi:hypothetical protein AXX17_AT1G28920 [Arabidopsis thaliana]|uniref:Transmembrane protein n=1 Tax=Arabidopsis thaliana TaxID=3702 RepID=A0A178WEA1_ARATH|nr:hypothetical protein AXX17_AT1G28920 [Arabidopsis thaliana]